MGAGFGMEMKLVSDPNPRPVSRIIKPQPVDEINEKIGLRTGLRVTIWPKAPAVTPAVLGFRSQVTFEKKPLLHILSWLLLRKAPVLRLAAAATRPSEALPLAHSLSLSSHLVLTLASRP